MLISDPDVALLSPGERSRGQGCEEDEMMIRVGDTVRIAKGVCGEWYQFRVTRIVAVHGGGAQVYGDNYGPVRLTDVAPVTPVAFVQNGRDIHWHEMTTEDLSATLASAERYAHTNRAHYVAAGQEWRRRFGEPMSQHCGVVGFHETCFGENTLGTHKCACPCHGGR